MNDSAFFRKIFFISLLRRSLLDICLYMIEADADVEEAMINDTSMLGTIIAIISSKKVLCIRCKIKYSANL